MGCHTWWYRLLQEDEAKYFIDAWIKHCNNIIEKTKDIILNKNKIDIVYLDMAKESAKNGYYGLDRHKYLIYLILNDYFEAQFIKNYLETSDEPYMSLNTMHHTYPINSPFNLMIDTFSDKIYISLFSTDQDKELLDKTYYKKLEKYEIEYNHHDVFRFYEYDTWVNSIDELKTILNSGKACLSKGITKAEILYYYQEIVEQFGDCKIQFG